MSNQHEKEPLHERVQLLRNYLAVHSGIGLDVLSELESALTEAQTTVEKLRWEHNAARQELRTIQKIAKADSLDDVLKHPAESEVALRLRLFQAIATLRAELMANEGHAGLVQRACDAAVHNLQRAESAEALLAVVARERDALTRELDVLLAACIKTIDDNLHLADGDDCTLIDLKRAITKAEASLLAGREDGTPDRHDGG